MRISAVAIIGVFILGFGALSSLSAIPAAYAATDLGSWCTGSGLSYSSSTCTVSGTITMSTSVEISTGETLLISGTGSLTINSGVTLTVDSGGTINIQNSAAGSEGIVNIGTITNSGTIKVENSFMPPMCTYGAGTCTVGIVNVGTITNSGTVTVENSEYIGVENEATITNSGTITVENSGTSTEGIYNNGGTITNSGAITIENSGAAGSIGIQNYATGTIANSGTITIENYNTPSTSTEGIENFATITNSGTITVENGGAFTKGLYNFGGGTITNSGTITSEPSGFNTIGIDNGGTITDVSCGTVTIVPGLDVYPFEGSDVQNSDSCTSTTTTSSQTGLVGPGTPVTDEAVVVVLTTGAPGCGAYCTPGGTPSGSVQFYFCGPTGTPTPCTISPGNAVGSSVTLSGGSAISPSESPTAAGYYCWSALYAPTGSFNGSSSTSTTSECFQGLGTFTVTVTSTITLSTTTVTTTVTQSVQPTLLIEARGSDGSPFTGQPVTVTGSDGSSNPITTDSSGNYLFGAGVLTQGVTYTASTVIDGVTLSAAVTLNGNSVILLEPTPAASFATPQFQGFLVVLVAVALVAVLSMRRARFAGRTIRGRFTAEKFLRGEGSDGIRT
jgi:fibronectin-binding autotransporter adhesin